MKIVIDTEIKGRGWARVDNNNGKLDYAGYLVVINGEEYLLSSILALNVKTGLMGYIEDNHVRYIEKDDGKDLNDLPEMTSNRGKWEVIK